MSATTFTVYTLSHCPYCVRAKELLRREGFEFEERHVEDDDLSTRSKLTSETGMKTFPQIFAGQELIGGYSDLKKLFDETKLQQYRCHK